MNVCKAVCVLAAITFSPVNAFAFSQADLRSFLATYKTQAYTTDDTYWALRDMRIIEAWKLLAQRKILPGEGVLIASPDSGVTKHPSIFQNGKYLPNIRFDLARDFIEGTIDATDALTTTAANPSVGHGTMVAAAILAPTGTFFDGKALPPGGAPAAQLIPIRISQQLPVVHSPALVETALRYAMKKGAHIFSISMAGPVMSDDLQLAISEAREQGMLVFCAAGQGVLSVQYPALATGTFAISGSTIDHVPWKWAAFGPKILVSAPAFDIWHSATTKNVDTGAISYSMSKASGTTFATAYSASIAALWLSYHGRDFLIQKYGASRIGDVFEQLVREHAHRTPEGWDSTNHGAGIIDAEALLKADLP
jgi:serine protease